MSVLRIYAVNKYKFAPSEGGLRDLGAAREDGELMAEVLAGVTDPIVRDKLVRGAAGRLGISETALLDAARQAWKKKRSSQVSRGRPEEERESPPTRPNAPRGYSPEVQIIELALCDERAARAGPSSV